MIVIVESGGVRWLIVNIRNYDIMSGYKILCKKRAFDLRLLTQDF